jgi:Aerotolerance regulator N-terminal
VIRWLNPAALAGLALVAVPIVIHLLRTHRAERITFPSLRFVRAAQTAAVRMRWPSDLLLLALRIAVVATSVVAVAHPVVLTPSRLEKWNARIARAIVVDSSDSMDRGRAGSGTPTAAASEASDAEKRGATYTVLLDDPDLRSGLRRALAWAEAAPPARREIVVISDFQRGSLTRADVAAVPKTVGLRFVRVGDAENAKTVTGLELFSAPEVSARRQEIAITPSATGVSVSDEGASRSGSLQPGLRIVGGEQVERLVMPALRAVAKSGAPAPSATQPVALMFSDSPTELPPVRTIRPRWMLQTILRLRGDVSLESAAREASATTFTGSEAWTTVAADKAGRALISAAENGDELLLHVAASAGGFIAAAALSAVLTARHGDTTQPEQEIAGIETSDLTAWSRAPAPVEQENWRRVEDSDARWFWLAALLLLALEPILRRAATREKEVRIAA